jgi:hypothetical protein
LFVFWNPRQFPPGRQPRQGPAVVCRGRVCVVPLEIKEQRDWGEVVANLANHDACPVPSSNVVAVCADCEQLWIKTAVDGKYREQSCPMPRPETIAASLLALMKRSS